MLFSSCSLLFLFIRLSSSSICFLFLFICLFSVLLLFLLFLLYFLICYFFLDLSKTEISENLRFLGRISVLERLLGRDCVAGGS